MLVASSHSLRSISLTAGSSEEFCRLPDTGSQFFTADVARGSSGLATDNQSVCVAASNAGETGLMQVPRETRTPTFLGLCNPDDGPLVGPARVGNNIIAYSKKRVWVLSAGRLSTMEWPSGFCPTVSGPHTGTVRTGFGSCPYFLSPDGFYALGNQGGDPALGLIRPGQEPVAIPLTTVAEGVVAVDAQGRPLVALDGRIMRCDGMALAECLKATQLVPKGLPYADGTLVIGVKRFATQRLAMGLFVNQAGRADCPLPLDYWAGMAFLACGTHLVHAYITDTQELRMLLWEC